MLPHLLLILALQVLLASLAFTAAVYTKALQYLSSLYLHVSGVRLHGSEVCVGRKLDIARASNKSTFFTLFIYQFSTGSVLHDSLFRLFVILVQILDALQADYRRAKFLRYGATASLLSGGGALTGASIFFGAPVELAVGAFAVTVVSASGLQVKITNSLPAFFSFDDEIQ